MAGINVGPNRSMSMSSKFKGQRPQNTMSSPKPAPTPAPALSVGPSPAMNSSMGMQTGGLEPIPPMSPPPPTIPQVSMGNPNPSPMMPPPMMGPTTPSRGIPFEQGGFIGPGMGPIDAGPTNYMNPPNAAIPGIGLGNSPMNPQMGGLRQAYGGGLPSSQFGNRRF